MSEEKKEEEKKVEKAPAGPELKPTAPQPEPKKGLDAADEYEKKQKEQQSNQQANQIDHRTENLGNEKKGPSAMEELAEILKAKLPEKGLLREAGEAVWQKITKPSDTAVQPTEDVKKEEKSESKEEEKTESEAKVEVNAENEADVNPEEPPEDVPPSP